MRSIPPNPLMGKGSKVSATSAAKVEVNKTTAKPEFNVPKKAGAADQPASESQTPAASVAMPTASRPIGIPTPSRPIDMPAPSRPIEIPGASRGRGMAIPSDTGPAQAWPSHHLKPA